MKLLDLFCGAGGASMGYHLAGFDVTGVDAQDMPRYPFEFHKADALEFLKEHGHEYDVIAASPPCQDHSTLAKVSGDHGTAWLLDATRQLLIASGKPYVIENVPGAPLRGALWLCGSEFGLTTQSARRGAVWIKRHRGFESNLFLVGAGGCNCYGRKIIGVYGNGDGGGRGWKGSFADRKSAMRIDWMNRAELAQSIPPAYTQFVGEQVITLLT